MERPNDKETMMYWDKIREAINDYPGSSLPTDMFESLIGQYDEYIDYLEERIKDIIKEN